MKKYQYQPKIRPGQHRPYRKGTRRQIRGRICHQNTPAQYAKQIWKDFA